ncbi:MAG TPA: sensor histidine kinase [Micropepsaceae bacterium]|nr:sensor histidine kinase [Micropepsaceae bacterium]
MSSSEPQGFDRAQEADRRTANSLALVASFIQLQGARAAERVADYGPDEVNMLLTGMAYRIDAVGQVHKILSTVPQEAVVDLGEHLQKMCSAMRPLVSLTGPVELCCDPGPDCMVPTENIVPIALIVSEMVTNAVKHAHPAGVAGRIDVGCHLDGSRIIVEVTDDGVGLPENFDVLDGGDLGFKMVRALASQLGALPIFDSCPLGLRFMLLLPKRNETYP